MATVGVGVYWELGVDPIRSLPITDTKLLLKQIAANPDCDTLRLAYADALEEEDADPTDRYRAAFIREAIHRGKMLMWVDRPHHYHCGFTALPPDVDGEFSRGFCVAIRCTLAVFRREATHLFSQEPVIREVELTDCSPWVGHDDAPLFGWSAWRGGYRSCDELPPNLLSRLRRNPPQYRNGEEPKRDLSQAAITLAREWAEGVTSGL